MIGRLTSKAIVLHLIIIFCGLWFLIPVLWGLLAGTIAGGVVLSNPEYQHKVESFLKERGISVKASPSELNADDKQELRLMAKDLLRKRVHWLLPVFGVTVLAFGVLGFVSGLVSRNVIMTGVIPFLACVFPPVYLRGEVGQTLAVWEKTLIIVSQFVVSFVFACLGAWTRGAPRASVVTSRHSAIK